jgi:hypothetical protein
MKHGCSVAVAAAVIAATAVASAPASATPQSAGASPLQLKRFMKRGPARRSTARAERQNVSALPETPPTPPERPKLASDKLAFGTVDVNPDADASPLTPKAVSTVQIPTRALALAPTPADHTVGFAAATEPWSDSAFASLDDGADLPPVTIARSDEVNAIDLSADRGIKVAQQGAAAGAFGDVPVVRPGNAATTVQSAPPQSKTIQSKTTQSSWASWAYGKVVDGVVTAALAVRSLF